MPPGPESFQACDEVAVAVTIPGETARPYLPTGFEPESINGPAGGDVGALLNFAWTCPHPDPGLLDEEIGGAMNLLRVTPSDAWSSPEVDFYFVIYRAYGSEPMMERLADFCLPLREATIQLSSGDGRGAATILAVGQRFTLDAASGPGEPTRFTDRIFTVEEGQITCVVEVDFVTDFPVPGAGLVRPEPDLPFLPGPALPGAGIVFPAGATDVTFRQVWVTGDAPLA